MSKERVGPPNQRYTQVWCDGPECDSTLTAVVAADLFAVVDKVWYFGTSKTSVHFCTRACIDSLTATRAKHGTAMHRDLEAKRNSFLDWLTKPPVKEFDWEEGS